MKILLIQIDKTQDKYIEEGLAVYQKRLKNYTVFDALSIQVPKALRQRSIKEQKSEEAKLLLQHLNPEDDVVLLDENGKEYNSLEFAGYIQKKQNSSVKRLVFVIGGPFGFDETIYARAGLKIALSRMTFSHQMVRLFFTEQLYRAFSILKGEKYHHN
jgi:23S rRNA (pseudouridine1915-N3)-methyltransferase